MDELMTDNKLSGKVTFSFRNRKLPYPLKLTKTTKHKTPQTPGAGGGGSLSAHRPKASYI